MDKQVNGYIEKQKSPQKEILGEIRRIFHANFPNLVEKMRWGVPTFGNGKFYVASMKNRVHVGFAITGLSEDEIKIFEGTGKTMRHIKINSLKEVDENKFVGLIELVNKKAICNECKKRSI